MKYLCLFFFGLERVLFPSLLWTKEVKDENLLMLFDSNIKNTLGKKVKNTHLRLNLKDAVETAEVVNQMLESGVQRFSQAVSQRILTIGFRNFSRVLLIYPKGILSYFILDENKKNELILFLERILEMISGDFYTILKETTNVIYTHNFYKEILEIVLQREPEIRLRLQNFPAFKKCYHLWKEEDIV